MKEFSFTGCHFNSDSVRWIYFERMLPSLTKKQFLSRMILEPPYSGRPLAPT